MSKGRIIPGKGFQYTPKTTVKWADEFNDLLDSHSSRNELMSRLIEDGLKVRNGSYKETSMYFPLEAFTHEQLALLNTEEGKKILYNVVSLILGNPTSVGFSQQIVQPISPKTEPVPWQIKPSNLKSDGDKEEKGKEEGNNSSAALSKLLKMGKMTNLRS